VSLLPPAGDDGLDAATSGRVTMCGRCGEAEGVLDCECCGDVLCPDCWGDADPFCERCLGEDEAEVRPVERVEVGEGYL